MKIRPSYFPIALQSYFYIFFLLLVDCAHFGTVVSDAVPPTTKYREVQSVSGSVGQIPCPVTSFDDVVMILWFKGNSGAPIYSYDARNEEVEPRHMTLKDDWGLRLYFRVWPNNKRSPALMIQDLEPGDQGLYRCRVDYRNSPTTNAVTRLKIIEPPTRLEIRDTSPSRPISDQQLISGNKQHSDPTVTYMGPYSEGQNVTLVCSAYGGKPLPEVRWYKNGEVVDTSYSLSGTEYTINEMAITNLGRNHTFDIYSCQANNNNETQALSHKVLLEIYLGVTNVELDVPSPMTAGSEYSIVCKTIGAYPTVKVEFWKNLKRIVSRSQMKSLADNVTITSIVYKPEILDDGAIIKCIAENPWVPKRPSVARKTMKIKYIPVAILRLGRNRTSAFSEGESVLMECHVKANPPAHTILWFHQGRQLPNGNNETAGIRISGMTLFISYLSYQLGGDFNCEAVNDVGKGISNTLPIELHLSPKCVTSEITQVPLAIGETKWLTCNILAWPSDLNFYWTLNRSDSNGEISSERATILGRNLTEHHRLPPISSMARGINTNVTFGRKSNSSTIRAKGVGMEPASKNQTGYPQLSSGSSESLDYPEYHHLPYDIPSKNAATMTTGRNMEETRSAQKDISFGRKEAYPEEKAISNKEGNSMTYSSSDVAFSTSRKDSFPSSYSNNNFKSSSPTTSSKEWTFSAKGSAKLTAPSRKIGAAEVRTKRHVFHNHQYFHNHQHQPSFSPLVGNTEGRLREPSSTPTTTGFQDKIRHTSLLSYEVKSDEDYGKIACFATNEVGSQVFPCLFNIVKKEDLVEKGDISDQSEKKEINSTKKKANSNKAGDTSKLGNLTVSLAPSTVGLAVEIRKKVESSQSKEIAKESGSLGPQRTFSKFQKTLGIVLLLILIFIAGLAVLALTMLLVLARRRREIRRIVIPPRGVASSSPSRQARPRSNNRSVLALFIGAFGNAKRSRVPSKGAPAVNKNSETENIITKEMESDEVGAKAATFSNSSAMFVVSSENSMDPFQEKVTNKGEPQLSYISSDPLETTLLRSNAAALATSNNSFRPALVSSFSNKNEDPSPNNNRNEGETPPISLGVKDIALFPPRAFIHCTSAPQKPTLNIDTSLQVQFSGMSEKQEGFKGITTRGELSGESREFEAWPTSNNDVGNVHSSYNETSNKFIHSEGNPSSQPSMEVVRSQDESNACKSHFDMDCVEHSI